MKLNLLCFLSVSLLACSMHAQISQKPEITYQDSLEGFDPNMVSVSCEAGHDSASLAQAIKQAERRFIDYKYQLGIYSPDYVYPGIHTNSNPIPMASCTNVNFETGDFTGWSGFIGDNNISSSSSFSNIQTGFFSTSVNAPVSDGNARHTIMTPLGGNDPYGGFPVVPPSGGNFTVRLGGETPNYQGEVIEQTFVVDAASTSFAYQYAVVLNDPISGHTVQAKPYFRIEVLDQTGQPISPCTQLFIAADSAQLASGGFILSPVTPPTFGAAYYKPWTLVNFDLSGYVNQNVTVRFTVAGCTQSGHFGYAYIDASCSALAAAVNFCPGNPTVILSAPGGYGGYQWLDPNHTPIPGATNDTFIVTSPVVGDTFYVYLTALADTSCHNTLPVVLEYTDIYPNAVATDETCYLYRDGTLFASGTAGIPPYTYSWNTVPPQNTQTATNVGPGTYIVHMLDSLGCEDYDTVTVVAAPRIDTSLFTYNYCFGDDHTLITAPFGYSSYTWIGPNGDTLPTPSPSNVLYVSDPQLGDIYYCILHTPPNCPIYDSLIFSFMPPPDYFTADTLINIFTPNGDGKNDFFYPFYDYTVASQVAGPAQPTYDFFGLHMGVYEVWVYDRWGKEVFYSNDYGYGWDGNFNQDKANDGVYYWIAKYASSCDESTTLNTRTGFVHLKR